MLPYKERSLYNVFSEIQQKVKKLEYLIVLFKMLKICIKFCDTKISRGNNREGLKASCVYMACKKNKVPRSAKEIAEIFKNKVSDMTKGCKLFLEIMNLNENKPKYNVKTSSASDYIERYCSNLNLSNEICEICKKTAQKATEYSIVEDNTPPSIAAGTIYMICNLYSMSITKKNVSKACKISEVTISKCFKKMNKYKKHLVDNIPKKKKKKSKKKSTKNKDKKVKE